MRSYVDDKLPGTRESTGAETPDRKSGAARFRQGRHRRRRRMAALGNGGACLRPDCPQLRNWMSRDTLESGCCTDVILFEIVKSRSRLPSPKLDSIVVCAQQTEVLCDPGVKAGNCPKSKLIGPKDNRVNLWVGCGLHQFLASEISTRNPSGGRVD